MIIVGIDLAKNVLSVHGVDQNGNAMLHHSVCQAAVDAPDA